MKAKTILMPHDGTPHAAVALPIARKMAEALGATLHILHVGESLLSPRDLLAKVGLEPHELRGALIDQAMGDPAAAILRAAAADSSLQIVMCSGTGVRKPSRPLGHVAEAVLLGAPCPVVLVRPAAGAGPWDLRRILFPHDGTPTTAEAFAPVAEIASRTGAELAVLHVPANVAQPVETGTLAAPRYVDQPQHEWPAWAEEFLSRLTCLGCLPEGLKLRLLVARGDPGTEVVRAARDQDSSLIAMAWHGHLEPERAATLRAVLAAAPCPVLVVRAAGVEQSPAGLSTRASGRGSIWP